MGPRVCLCGDPPGYFEEKMQKARMMWAWRQEGMT